MNTESFFDTSYNNKLNAIAPLAARTRPDSLDDFVGQRHIVGKGRLLRRMIAADRMTSVIFYGPSGTGKTTLANIIAKSTKSAFVKLNAVTSGVADIKTEIENAKALLGQYGRTTILFIDEIHRFNKAQQDALLPAVENATLILIGATTEDPYFEVNNALVSRTTVFKLEPLRADDIKTALKRALTDKKNGLGEYSVNISKEAVDFLSDTANGDLRIALNALELAFLTTEKNKDGDIVIDIATAQDCIQKRAVKYDKHADNHHDTISAFIKSMRGSDADAALYWLAKMLYAGEDPKFIARRMVIFASEDISNAVPEALSVAVSVFKAVEVIGMPECRINLAQGAVYLALCPKSNASYMGLERAMRDIENKPTAQVPAPLRSDGHPKNKTFGNGVGYKYPHEYKGHYVRQSYLPEGYENIKYYIPDMIGTEKKFIEYWHKIKSEN